MRVAIVGSRDFPKLSWVRDFVDHLPAGTLVVSGAARGVDRAAEQRAAERGLDVVSYEADWSLGKGAGLARNSEIVARADAVVAFWDGESRGTMDTVRKGRAAGKPTFLIDATNTDAPQAMHAALDVIRQRKIAAGAAEVVGS